MKRLASSVLIVIGLAGVVATAAAWGTRSSGPAVAGVFAPFGEPIPGIDEGARARFDRGRRVAMRRFAPSEGLGPAYNATSCHACHEKPAVGGGASRYRGVPLEPHSKKTFIAAFDHHYTTRSLDPSHGRPHATHLPPAFFGLGLLAEIPAEEILSRADPSDRNHDGIRGKVNFERGFLGRFGRKSQMSSLQGFVRLALLDHMGVTTDPVKAPDVAEGEAPVEIRTRDADGAPDPELASEDLVDLLAFVALLAPPPPDRATAETRAGEASFDACGCTACHVPSMRGPRGPIFAYTDLLLHDMGEELADDVVVGEANGRDYRTAPLWGLAAAGPYLHDGRADTIDDAIRAHGGEGAVAARRYASMRDGERRALVAFLRSLGGGQARPDGLLPKDAPLPEPGTLGGPAVALSPEDASRFLRGRDLFDHDFRAAEGLGPSFNGDACRSCHFDPVIGGAGTADVDVVRHGSLLSDGTFEFPNSGDTMAHRFALGGRSPFFDTKANLLERRQTPTLFGAGLIDAIPDEILRALADPDDRDGDGIRGVVRVLPSGKIGRFGWKGQMASVADFVEDAFANELGVTKGELKSRGEGAFDDVVFFVTSLAPPPRRPLAHDDEARGRAAFEAAGCSGCHKPELPTRTGLSAALYSDLLLHDVVPKSERVLADPSRAFRTPPLLGIAGTAPYFHDGMAETIEQAILRHDVEARASRDRYAEMRESERAALVAFVRSL